MARGQGKLPKRMTKQTLPEKTCPVCQRPFFWRRKWAKDWDRVIYCSDRCAGTGHRG